MKPQGPEGGVRDAGVGEGMGAGATAGAPTSENEHDSVGQRMKEVRAGTRGEGGGGAASVPPARGTLAW